MNKNTWIMSRLSDLHDGEDSVRKIEKVGDFYWDLREGRRDLVIAVPWPPHSGKAIWSSWSIDYKNDSDASWTWDGNEDKPTLNPSIHWISYFSWMD